MAHIAQGTFEVKIGPLPLYNNKPGSSLGRYSIDKQFSGGLAATSKGEMLSAGSPQASGGYVAVELVEGKLDGKEGSFVLQHTGTMDRGKPAMSVSVVPDSGTGALQGLSGDMTIGINEGKHNYQFNYHLAAPEA